MDQVLKDMCIKKTRDRLQDLQNSTIKNINEESKSVVDEILKDVEKCEVSREFHQLFQKNNANETSDNGKLHEKTFVPRNSLLTDLFEVKHIGTIRNMCTVIVAFIFLHSALDEYQETGRVNLGISTIQRSFQGLFPALIIWICMFVITLFVYNVFGFWAHVYVKLKPNSNAIYIWNYLWLISYILYQVIFMAGFAYWALQNHYAFATGFALFGEQTRFMMKWHAFVRTNVPRVFKHSELTKLSIGSPSKILPEFSKYFYFLFAPTLIYRDSYPRTKEIRWGFLLWNVFETIVVFFLWTFIVEKFLIVFVDYGTIHYDYKMFLLKILGVTLPALAVCMVGFYFLQHSWLNVWAEGLRFADRLFYKDWWNAKDYGEYFRKWNVVVHEWLYIYIYRELRDNVSPNNRVFPIMSVFLISSIFHEYIMGMAVGLFYPVLIVFFTGLGTITILVTKQLQPIFKQAGNIILWIGLSFINAVIFSLYVMEVYARRNCNYQNDSIYAFLIPHSWFCDK